MSYLMWLYWVSLWRRRPPRGSRARRRAARRPQSFRADPFAGILRWAFIALILALAWWGATDLGWIVR